MSEFLVFSTDKYNYLRDSICREDGFNPGEVEKKNFPDGERYLRILSDCSSQDVVVVGGTISDEDTLELYDLASGLVHYGAKRLSIVVPFFGYSTMERSTHFGEIVTAKNRARLLSSIPAASNGNLVYVLDLHATGITHYFEGNLRPVHIYAKSIINDATSELGGADYVLGCTDAGRAKWVESLANDAGVTAAFVYKRRLDGHKTEVTGVSAHVQGKAVVIYDDMIRTGSSLIGAAQAYKDAGATHISAITTHGIFPEDSLARIQKTGLFTKIVATDSHPRAVTLQNDFLEVKSLASLLSLHLKERQ